MESKKSENPTTSCYEAASVSQLREGESYDYAASTERLLHHIRGIPQWRYRCPDADCRCSNIVVRELLGDVKRYNEVSKGTRPEDRPSIGAFRCKQCGLGFDEPYDAKNDQTRPLQAFV